MAWRWSDWRVLAGIGIGAYLLVLLGGLFFDRPDAAPEDEPPMAVMPVSGNNPLGNPPGMVDRLVFLDTAEQLRGASRDNVAAATSGIPRLKLVGLRPRDYPQQGQWTSAEVPSEFPFTELLPSWNASMPKDTGLRFHVRVRDAERQQWSPWLYFGSFGRTRPPQARTTSFAGGAVSIDVLVLSRPADAFQVKVDFFSFDLEARATPTLWRMAVSYSGVVEDEARRRQLQPQVQAPEGWARDLGVPFRTQKDAPPALAGEICSPTSVSMVMEHFGVDVPTVDNALAIYDEEAGIFGNWARAVQRAAELGFDSYLTRFRNWEQVKAQIAAGQPVIASIRFGKGEFRSSVFGDGGSDGHLIVIRGFTPAGDVIVNDPASKEKGDGAVYKADELARAWFGCGGVGYIIRTRQAAREPETALRP